MATQSASKLCFPCRWWEVGEGGSHRFDCIHQCMPKSRFLTFSAILGTVGVGKSQKLKKLPFSIYCIIFSPILALPTVSCGFEKCPLRRGHLRCVGDSQFRLNSHSIGYNICEVTSGWSLYPRDVKIQQQFNFLRL